MIFKDIIGHDRPVTILKRAIANNALAHAYLFSGEEGLGKKMTAFALAAAVNCHEPESGGGCGACPACRKTAARSHPDVHVLVPDGDEIKIDQIREAQSDLALKPFEGTKKVLIVDGAEAMNPASSNAFLKTLEEPPGDALIILITSRSQSLLPTIRSRCQEIRFHPLPRRALAEALMHKRGLTDDDARFLAALSRGRLGRALEMDVEEEKAARDEFMTLRSRLAATGPEEALMLAEPYAKDRQRLERLLDIGVERLRDAVVYHETGDERLLVHAQSGNADAGPPERLPLQRVLSDMELFTMSRELLGRRVSAQLVAEHLFLKLGKA